MSEQLQLLSVESKIDEAFKVFNEANPHVLRQLVQLTNQAKARGITRVGMKSLFEICRWNHMLRTAGQPFKLNNNFTSRYTRLIEAEYPELKGMFETRTIRS